MSWPYCLLSNLGNFVTNIFAIPTKVLERKAMKAEVDLAFALKHSTKDTYKINDLFDKCDAYWKEIKRRNKSGN